MILPIPPIFKRERIALLLFGLALALYWFMAVSVSPRMGVTADEVVHLTGGYSYWTLNDYRLHPENGNLAQRIATLPLAAEGLHFPPLDDPHWVAAQVNLVGERFFYHMGNDVARMLLLSRMMIALTGAFTVWLTWRWSRSLFGAKAGWLALGLAVFSPTLLAHGGLATSDIVMTACTLGALGAVWQLLHRATWLRLGMASLACGLAFLSKMSGVIIVPIIALLIVLRCLQGAPLVIAFGTVRWLRAPVKKFITAMALMTVVAAGSLVVLWAGFGFRYAGNNPDRAPASGYYFSWDVVLSKEPIPQPAETSLDQLLPQRKPVERKALDYVIEWVRDHRLLPEAYLWGFAQTSKFSKYRPSYLKGDLSTEGWPQFFPLAFLLKSTPAALILGMTGLASLLWIERKRRQGITVLKPWVYRGAPMLLFFIIYWCMAVRMNLNIGHRHILPTYPAFYILASASVLWLRPPRRSFIGIGLIAGLCLHAGESLLARPFYLSYFSSFVGGPDRGYHYLVDSSFDWGQGLPDLEQWLDDKKTAGDTASVYLSYFGADSPRARNLDVVRFGDEINDSGLRVFPAHLRQGYYVISATNFVQVYSLARGPWNQQKEELYNRILERLRSPEAKHPETEAQITQIRNDCMDLELLQASRLFNFLTDRTPLQVIGGSLLVFQLTNDELQEALYKPWDVQ